MTDSVYAKKNWVLTQEAFDSLLAWLDRDRDRAGQKYEEIRSALIKLFAYRGCHTPEDQADETINRVAKKIDALAESYAGDPALYFYGVAQMIHLEYLRKKSDPPPPPVYPPDNFEQEYQCLEECLDHLAPENRELILQYYSEEAQTRMDNRKQLAGRLGIGLNALRIRAYRLRQGLESCVEKCLNRKNPA